VLVLAPNQSKANGFILFGVPLEKRQHNKVLASKVFIVLVSFLVVLNLITSPMALAFGFLIAIFMGNPWANATKAWCPKILSYSIVALGAGMNLTKVLEAGVTGFSYTFISIFITIFLGALLIRLIKSDYESSALVVVGTAICGGSAIAAASSAIQAKPSSMSMALAIVFLLNSMALLIFPSLGHWIGFSDRQFGLWAALAIHDTSSVVGSALLYGPEALEVGTVVKLARALWIIPVTFLVSIAHQKFFGSAGTGTAPKKPWFILGFLVCAGLFTYTSTHFPDFDSLRNFIASVGKRGLVLALFFIGLNINIKSLREIGGKTVFLGVFLWIFVSIFSAIAIYAGLIS
jgi:uncharacterized integral membrane protein (TIGR00698 family)